VGTTGRREEGREGGKEGKQKPNTYNHHRFSIRAGRGGRVVGTIGGAATAVMGGFDLEEAALDAGLEGRALGSRELAGWAWVWREGGREGGRGVDVGGWVGGWVVEKVV
jgi:hypothetical protein